MVWLARFVHTPLAKESHFTPGTSIATSDTGGTMARKNKQGGSSGSQQTGNKKRKKKN
jgi:hypothetical protein